MNNYPYHGIVACHRVVKSDKCVGGYAYGVMIKTNMLTMEGIKIKNGKVLDWEESFYCF